MVEHGVVVGRLPASRLAHTLRFDMGSEVHVREIDPDKERLAGRVLFFDKLNGPGGKVVVDCLHTLLGQRARVFDFLFPVWRSKAVDYASRSESFQERGVLRIVR